MKTCTVLKGGLSHQVIRVDEDGRSHVARILDPAVSAAGLGIAPEQEIANTVLAAGVGPRVLRTYGHTLELEYIDGRTLDADDVREPALIPRVAEACRRLHAGPAFGNDFDIAAKAVELHGICREHGLDVPDGYAEALDVLARIQQAFVRRVPCHNDLLPANLMDDGTIRIIDYQLSGNNDPAFELGDLAAEADFDLPRVELLTRSYFADPDDAELARVRLGLLASNIAWTLWFSVHHGLLPSHAGDFSYADEAAAKWARAVRDLSHPDLGRLLHAARKVP